MPNTPVSSPEMQNDSMQKDMPRARYSVAEVPVNKISSGTTEVSGWSIREIIDMLLRRWRWMILVFGVVFCLGVLHTITTTRQFSSTSEVMIRVKNPFAQTSLLPGILSLEDFLNSTSINTEIRWLRSMDFQQSVFNGLSPDIRKAGFPDVTVDKNEKESSVITITVVSITPRMCAAMANAMVEKLIARDEEENVKATAKAIAYIDQERVRVSKELKVARSGLATFETTYGVINDSSGNNTGKLALLTAQSSKLESDKSDAEQANALSSSMKAQFEQRLRHEDPMIVSAYIEDRSPILDKIDQELVDLETRRTEIRMTYADGAPEIQRINDLIKAKRAARADYLAVRVSSKTHSMNPQFQELLKQYMQACTDEDTSNIRQKVLKVAIDKLQQELSQLPPLETRGAELRSKVMQLESTNALMNQAYETLRITEASKTSNVLLLSVALENTKPISPNVPRNIAVTLLMGLVLALGVAMVLESFDDRVHSQANIERISSRPLLAYIPRVPEGESPQLLHGTHGRSSILEGMRLLRSNLAFAAMDNKSQHILAVTSPGSSEGKTTTAINLAVVFALDGKKVVLVDADLRRPSLHSYFELERKVGLTSVATGSTPLDEALQPTFIEGISLLATGPLPPNPPEVLNAKSTRQVFAELQKRFDVVIVDTPPAAGLSDVPVISTLVDGIIFVISAEQTHCGQLQMALQTLEQIGAPILGFILNKIDTTRSHYRYYYYYYYNYYNYNYGQEGEDTGTGEKQKRHRHRRGSDKSIDRDDLGASNKHE